MLFATQRQLGLPLSCLAGITDLPSDVDPYGDAAINSCSDHSTRHNHLTGHVNKRLLGSRSSPCATRRFETASLGAAACLVRQWNIQ